jgi:hypothetical protein
MTTIFLKLIRQIHNINSLKRTFFNADTAPAAKHFRDESFIAFYTNSFHSTAHHGTVAYAKLITFFDLALVGV